jgi:small ligand-binding sensory domain FIST
MYGCRAVSSVMTVTRATKNIVLELSGKPAFKMLERVMAEVADSMNAKGQAKEGENLTILVGIVKAEKTQMGIPPKPNEFYVRPIVAVDPASRGIVLGESVNEGSHVTFVLREKTWAREELSSKLIQLKKDMTDGPPRFGFYFNCAGRGENLFGSPDHDINMIRQALGEFPLIGISSSFELAPQGERLAMHGFTGVLAIFS